MWLSNGQLIKLMFMHLWRKTDVQSFWWISYKQYPTACGLKLFSFPNSHIHRMNGALETQTKTKLLQHEWRRPGKHERSKLFSQTKTSPAHKNPSLVTAYSGHKVLFGGQHSYKDPVGAHYPPDLKIAMGSLHQNPSLQLASVQCTN